MPQRAVIVAAALFVALGLTGVALARGRSVSRYIYPHTGDTIYLTKLRLACSYDADAVSHRVFLQCTHTGSAPHGAIAVYIDGSEVAVERVWQPLSRAPMTLYQHPRDP